MSALTSSPLISLAINHASPEMTKMENQSKKSKKTPMAPLGDLKAGKPQPKDAPMTSASIPTWKPPTHQERLQEAGKNGMVDSTRDWVAGRISTKQHKENLTRAKVAANYKL